MGISVYITISYSPPIHFILIEYILCPLSSILCTRYSLPYLIRIIPFWLHLIWYHPILSFRYSLH
nr:MAG TPA: hypothetical protein [Crassvirales sp.]